MVESLFLHQNRCIMVIRDSYFNRINDAFRYTPIVILIGSRQVGKTTLMKTYPTAKFEATHFVNGQDVDVANLFSKLNTIEDYLKVYLNPKLDGLLFIDEFQYIQGVSTILKLLTDKYTGLRIMCSGSSSLDILQKVEESLAGRVRIIEVLSLSFAEYLKFKDEKLYLLQQSVSADTLPETLIHYYNEYLVFGGFPRVALADNYNDKAELLNDIYQTYLMNDVRHYIANEHFVGFNRLLRLLAAQIGNLVNVNELCRESGLSYNVCEEYIALLQKMYIIKLVEPYFTNKRKIIGKMRKVYFCDLGLRNIIYNSFNEITYRVDNGALFENEVLLELWRNNRASDTIYFYRTHNGVEVDFIKDTPIEKIAIECKYKYLLKPISVTSLNNISMEEGISKRYIANINLSTLYKDAALIPGIFADRIK